MYKYKRKISLLLSSIAIMFGEIQGEKQVKQEYKRSKAKWRQEDGQIFFIFFETVLFEHL